MSCDVTSIACLNMQKTHSTHVDLANSSNRTGAELEYSSGTGVSRPKASAGVMSTCRHVCSEDVVILLE